MVKRLCACARQSHGGGEAGNAGVIEITVRGSGLGLAKEDFMRQLGIPLFLEDWGTPHCCFFILACGTEGELWIGSAGRFAHIHGGPYVVLVDKQGLVAHAEFPLPG